jgi:hypothetical protein
MRFALFVLALVARGSPYQEELIGDLLQELAEKERELGPAEARRWLWGQVFRSIPPMLLRRLERAIGRCELALRSIGSTLRRRSELAIEELHSIGAMLRRRLEGAIEKLRPEALVVWMVQIALLLYLLPAILTILLLHLIFIIIFHISSRIYCYNIMFKV